MSLDLKKEALLNEYKGSLFEFLVARSLATTFDLETSFLNSLSDNQLAMFEQQESYLRHYFPQLLISLPVLAKSSALRIIEQQNLLTAEQISLVGMNAGDTTEADIIISSAKNKLPVSLKISKYGSYTNTKSAGVKTFFSKYFKVDQSEFNFLYEQKFEEFTYALLADAGLNMANNFHEWENLGLPNLPGQLTGYPKEKLFNFYKEMNLALFDKLEGLYRFSPENFNKAVMHLIGFSDTDLVQLTCFYKNDDKGYRLESISIKERPEILSLTEAPQLKLLEKTIEVIFSKLKLQIRLKPMNKFTASSYKINCAVKFN